MRTLGEPDAASATSLLQKHVPIPKETDVTLRNGAEHLRASGRGTKVKQSKTHYPEESLVTPCTLDWVPKGTHPRV